MGSTPTGVTDAYSSSPLGYESAVVNGQLINVAPAAAYTPLVFAGAYSGPAWPRQGVYDVPPVLPSPAAMTGVSGYNNYGASSGTYPTATDEYGNPFHLTKSPLWWVLGFLAASLLFLHYVVYK
jgi:hypothetical protein